MFAVTISLTFLPILLLVYGIRSPFAGAFELFGDSWFCVGMLAAVALLVASQYVGIRLANRILASEKSTIIQHLLEKRGDVLCTKIT